MNNTPFILLDFRRAVKESVMMERRLYLTWLQVVVGLLNFPDHGLAVTLPDKLPSKVGDFVNKDCYVSTDKFKAAQCFSGNVKSVPNYLENDIVELMLRSNMITNLSANSFRRYTILEHLDLSYNDITFIANTALSPLGKLRWLDLSHNLNLMSIRSDIFQVCENLRFLNLSKCHLTTVPHDIFKWLPRLQEIKLSRNSISLINFTVCPDVELQLFSLVETNITALTTENFIFPCRCDILALQYNVIQVLDYEVIASLSVKSLTLGFIYTRVDLSPLVQFYKELMKGISRSSIEALTLGYFDGRIADSILELGEKILSKLDFVQLQFFDGSVFRILSRVQCLSVFYSDIGLIQPSYFEGMNNLVDLAMPYNRILKIDSSSSRWNTSLQSLDLNMNLLTYIDSTSFSGLDKLLFLDLSNNRILKHISLTLLNLEYLNISQTEAIKTEFNVPKLANFIFSGRLANPFGMESSNFFETFKPNEAVPSLKKVDLSDSHIYCNELWDSESKTTFFHSFKNVIIIFLDANPLRYLPDGIFPQLIFLQELYLSKCKLSLIGPRVFEGMHSLLILSIEENNLASLSPSVFFTTTSLEALYVVGNVLTFLDDNLFKNTHRLSNLSLARNDFTSFNMTAFRPIMSSLRIIDISNNPLECSCSMKLMVEWLRNRSDIKQFRDAKCSFDIDRNLRGESLIFIDPQTMCYSQLELYWLVPFLVIVLAIFIASAVHLKWLVRYKIFLLKLALLGYREAEDARDHNDFQFDLNIMFTGDDQEWAAHDLRQALNQKLPEFQRVTFGDDDLPLGMYYLDAVLYLIEHSFKTILLLSRAATHDNEFMMKVRIALDHMTDTNMQSAVLVFLENIPEEEMPYLVKLYISEQMPYINWEESEEGQREFWKKFVKRLKVNVRRNDMVPPV